MNELKQLEQRRDELQAEITGLNREYNDINRQIHIIRTRNRSKRSKFLSEDSLAFKTVIDTVLEYYQTTLDEVRQYTRMEPIITYRKNLAYIMHYFFNSNGKGFHKLYFDSKSSMSTGYIAAYVGLSNHGTVINHVGKIDYYRKIYPAVDKEMTALILAVESNLVRIGFDFRR